MQVRSADGDQSLAEMTQKIILLFKQMSLCKETQLKYLEEELTESKTKNNDLERQLAQLK